MSAPRLVPVALLAVLLACAGPPATSLSTSPDSQQTSTAGDEGQPQASPESEVSHAFVPVEGYRDTNLMLRVLPETPLERDVRALLAAAQTGEALARAAAEVSTIEQQSGPDVPELIGPLGLMAEALSDAGQVHQGVEALDRALRIATEAYAPDDPRTLQTRYRRGVALARANRPGDALAVFDGLLRPVEEAFGRSSEHYAAVLAATGPLRQGFGQSDAALEALEQARTIAQRRLSPESRGLALVKLRMAEALFSLSRMPEAQQLLEDLLAHSTDASIADALVRVNAGVLLTRVSSFSGDREAAERHSERAVREAALLAQMNPMAMGRTLFEARYWQATASLGGPRTLDGLSALDGLVAPLAHQGFTDPAGIMVRAEYGKTVLSWGFPLEALDSLTSTLRDAARSAGEGSLNSLPIELAIVEAQLAAGDVLGAAARLPALLSQAESAAATARIWLIASLAMAGQVAQLAGDAAEAERHFRRALDQAQRFAPSSYHVPSLIARLLALQHRRPGAGDTERALNAALVAQQSPPPLVLGIAAQLATDLAGLHDDRAALDVAERGLAAVASTPGPSEREAGLRYVRLALLVKMGDLDTARNEAAYFEGLCGNALPADLMPCVGARAQLLRASGDGHAAVRGLVALAEGLLQRLPPRSVPVLAVLELLSEAAVAHEQASVALPVMEAWARRVDAPGAGNDHVWLARTRASHCALLAAAGRRDEARALAERVLATVERYWPAAHPGWARLRSKLAPALGTSP